MEEKDDEISIDLGKIKNFFKRKKEKEIDPKPTEERPELHIEIENKDQEIKQEDKTQSQSNIEKKSTEEKDDEDINIDFGKIKNIFKKKETNKEEKISTQESPNEEKDDEISIDFSKIKNIKNIFKGSKKTDSDDDVSVDFKKISDFFVKYRVVLLLIIPIFLSIFLRVQPAYLPITDTWATDTVINNLRSQIREQIDQQYPNLPDQNKNVLLENELQKVLQQQKSQVDQQIEATSNLFKSRLRDDSGQTYLLAIDPYFWMRHARNILENGHPGDETRNGKHWDNHMLAPIGREIPFDMFHAYFIAYLFKFFAFFSRDINLMTIVFFTPVIISALSVIPAFFITRKIAGNFGGFIAATIVAIHPSFLSRTAGGFADTDAYTVMFPLFIAWFFFEALEAKNIKKSVIFSSVGGFLVGLYSFAWSGWWYIFDFILASVVFYIAYYLFVHKKELILDPLAFSKKKTIKNSLSFLVIFFIVSALSVSLFVNSEHFTEFSKGPLGFTKLKEVDITKIWPNVYTTVAEQNPASLDNVINQGGLGKIYFFLIALMGITLTLTTRERKKLWFVIGSLVWYLIIFLLKIQNLNIFLLLISIPIIIRILVALWESDTGIDIKYAIFLVLWFIATTYASTKGVRFTLLLVPAFAIGFGIALGEIYRYTSFWISKGLKVNKYISKTTVIIILLLLLIAPYKSAADTSRKEIPNFNDAWAISLEKIKSDSNPNAIITSWWDFGHWFKFWADRAVTFDGTTQNTAQAHFIGKVLLTGNEDTAIAILRMLDCGERQGFDIINELTADGAEALEIVNEIILLDKKKAKEILAKHFDGGIAEKVLENTHCEPPENYFITSQDMIKKSGVWAHFGSWDFDRALIYNTLKKAEYNNDLDKSIEFLQERLSYEKEDAENIFYDVQSITTSKQANDWIAPWPGYAGTTDCNKIGNQAISCNVAGIPLIINLTVNDAYADTNNGILHPKLVSFPTNKGITLKEYNESIITLQNGRHLGIALIKNGESYRVVAMDSDLTASMFTRMFYQEGIGLKHFKKFSDESSVFGSRIMVWKVDWEGKEKNVIETPKAETEEEEEVETEIETNETKQIINKTEVEEESNITVTNDSQNASSVTEEVKTEIETNKTRQISNKTEIEEGLNITSTNDSQDLS